LSADQAKRFLAYIQTDRLYPLYLLAIFRGLRQGELLGVHREDVDLPSRVVHVNHLVQELQGVGLIITEPKTDSSWMDVAIPPISALVLQKLQQETGTNPGTDVYHLSRHPVFPAQPTPAFPPDPA
jgi:integrase